MAFVALDVLALAGREAMVEPWADRRKRPGLITRGLSGGAASARCQKIPLNNGAPALW